MSLFPLEKSTSLFILAFIYLYKAFNINLVFTANNVKNL